MKTSGWLVLLLVILLVSSNSWTEDLSRSKQLEADVIILKRTVMEQGSRIETLERQLSSGRVSSSPPVRHPSSQSSSNFSGWQNPANWIRVKDGMFESQVVSILGQPTSVKNIRPYRTIFYWGEVGRSGFVSGNVKFNDDRVWKVNKPVF